MPLYRYVGPTAIRDLPRGEAGTCIRSPADLARWLHTEPEALRAPATFVVDADGLLRLAPCRTEHIDCAAGDPVRAAGEVRFARSSRDGFVVVEITNQSTGYCPDPDCWPAVHTALNSAGIAAPPGFTSEFLFRKCPQCAQTNLVKEEDFTCAVCDAVLPPRWNF
jgi:hypothetical protein